MPLPKRPSGGTTPQKVVPPKFGEQENSTDVDFALPELDDFVLPEIELETRSEESVSTSEKLSNSVTVLDSSKNRITRPSSTNQDTPKPPQTAVSDVLGMNEDEDEETALDRELGLLDDDLLDAKSSNSTGSTLSDDEEDLEDEDEYADNQSEADSSLIELEESPSETEDDDTEFEDLLRGLEETVSISESKIEEPVEDDVDTDWEAAFSELEAFNDSASSEASNVSESDSDDEEDDDEDEEEDGDWSLEAFTPPANPFEALPEDFQNASATDDEDEEEEDDTPEDDFIPPSDPFANPFKDEESSSDDDEESTADNEETNNAASKPSLKDKVASQLSPAKAKQSIADYFAKINAELHGEEPPKPGRRPERNSEEQDQEEESEDQVRRAARSPLKIFGFLAPVRSFYTAIVNIIFGIITTILGILSKLPLVGFIFKIALEATKILRAIAQYIPLAFFIAALVAVSYFSVPRDSLIILPDSGGATFTNFTYDSASNSASGIITNTGDIIADVQPEFTVKTIQPGLNPISWVIPEDVSKCATESVRVDIDSTTKVTAKCSDAITGFIPRVTGELK